MDSIFDKYELNDMPQAKPVETGIDNIKAYSDISGITALIACNMPEHIPVLDPLYDNAKFWIEQQLNRTFPGYNFKLYRDKISAEKIKPWEQLAFAQGFGSNPFINPSSL